MSKEANVGDLVLPVNPGGRAALTPLAGGERFGFAGEAMGTSFAVSLVLDDEALLPRLEQRFERVLATVIAQMSQWAPDSQLSRFNVAPAGSWHEIGAQFAAVLDCALEIARLSDGAFDPTIGGSSELWGFGTRPAPDRVPAREAMAAARDQWRWFDIEFDTQRRRLLQPGRLRLDLSGIAKGFAVDMALAALRREGVQHALVEIGGEAGAIGVKPDGQPWWVECQPLPGSTEPPARIALSGWCVASSGDWQRAREVEDQRYSHTLSPETGEPIGPLRAATVLHRGCMQADALATALMVMGEEDGLAFCERFNIPARMVTPWGETVDSALWRKFCEA